MRGIDSSTLRRSARNFAGGVSKSRRSVRSPHSAACPARRAPGATLPGGHRKTPSAAPLHSARGGAVGLVDASSNQPTPFDLCEKFVVQPLGNPFSDDGASKKPGQPMDSARSCLPGESDLLRFGFKFLSGSAAKASTERKLDDDSCSSRPELLSSGALLRDQVCAREPTFRLL